MCHVTELNLKDYSEIIETRSYTKPPCSQDILAAELSVRSVSAGNLNALGGDLGINADALPSTEVLLSPCCMAQESVIPKRTI